MRNFAVAGLLLLLLRRRWKNSWFSEYSECRKM